MEMWNAISIRYCRRNSTNRVTKRFRPFPSIVISGLFTKNRCCWDWHLLIQDISHVTFGWRCCCCSALPPLKMEWLCLFFREQPFPGLPLFPVILRTSFPIFNEIHDNSWSQEEKISSLNLPLAQTSTVGSPLNRFLFLLYCLLELSLSEKETVLNETCHAYNHTTRARLVCRRFRMSLCKKCIFSLMRKRWRPDNWDYLSVVCSTDISIRKPAPESQFKLSTNWTRQNSFPWHLCPVARAPGKEG